MHLIDDFEVQNLSYREVRQRETSQYMSLGARLREIRRSRGLTQAQFATIGGIKANTQLAYEAESRSPDSAYLIALHESGIDVGYLLTGRRSGAALSPEESDLVSTYRRIDPEARTTLVQLLKQIARVAPPTTVHQTREAFRGEES